MHTGADTYSYMYRSRMRYDKDKLKLARVEINKSYDIHDFLNLRGLRPYNNRIPCPFHADSDPSMVVHNRMFHCFSCGVHGAYTELVYYFLNRLDEKDIGIPEIVNNLLSEDRELSQSLGFSTIYMLALSGLSSTKTEEGKTVFIQAKPHKALGSYKPITLGQLFKKQQEPEDIISFIATCQNLGSTEDIIKSITSQDFIQIANKEEVGNQLMSIMLELHGEV